MVVEAIKSQAEAVWQYGDPESFDLIQKLSDFYTLPKENFVIGEGIDGLLGNLVRLFVEPGDEVVSSLGATQLSNIMLTVLGATCVLSPIMIIMRISMRY